MTAAQRLLSFLSLLLVALTLGPALAHLLELPAKLGLARDDYFVVQGIYEGWALLGILVIGALLATLALAVASRHERGFSWALAAFLCLVAAQALFWLFTYPANAATSNWTAVPADWERLRSRWEWSHAGGAALTLAALLCLLAFALGRVPRAGDGMTARHDTPTTRARPQP